MDSPVIQQFSVTSEQVALSLDKAVNPTERVLFVICALVSACFYFMTLLLVVLSPALLVYGIALFIAVTVIQGLLIGHIRGSAIRVSPKQFPEIHQVTDSLCHQLGMPVPPVYILQSGGVLNAFASRFLMTDYVVLYSDVVELAYEEGQDALGFVVAHELAHVRRGHMKRRFWILPGLMMPFLGKAYSRACEYTCDRMAAHCLPSGALQGILLLSAGKQLYKQVNVHAFSSQEHLESGLWTWLSELFSTHPHLTKRLNALLSLPAIRAQVA